MAKVIPILYTKELQKSINFYCEVLDFNCAAFDDSYGWANVRKNDAEIMFSLPNEHVKFDQPVFSGSIYIRMKNIDVFWNSIQEKVKIAYPLESSDYGMREFALYDNNGYLIQFGEELDKA